MRFLKLIGILALFLLCPPAKAGTFNAKTFTLDNGLQVVLIENHRAPVVSHMIWYKFGGADEKPGESGIAHFFEHLMFKGTRTVPDGEFSLRVKKMGGNENAFTSHDYTAYYQNVALEHLEDVMAMEADRMTNLTLSEEQIASEREVIVEERRMRIDNQPQAKFQEQVRAALFINHPYATPVIGWMQEIKGLTREQALDYYRAWYAPNNAILVVSGDITQEKLRTLAKKYYGVIPSKELPERKRPQPAPLAAEHRIISKDKRNGLPVISFNYRAQKGSDALEILAEIFGGTATSRLYKNLVVDQKQAVSAGASYDAVSLDQTTFSIYASPTPGTSLEELEQALEGEIKTLLDKGITARELSAAKDRTLADFVYYLDSLQGPAMLFGQALASGLGMDYLENRSARIEKLSIEDINRAADDVFSGKDFPVKGMLLPLPAAEGDGT